jgi:RNA polymerase sigma factor (sigma-70 family)
VTETRQQGAGTKTPAPFLRYTGKAVEQKTNVFDAVLQENRDTVFNLLFRLTGDRHVSEDLFQETFLRVYRGLQSFRGEAKFSTWVYTIALNVFRDYVRKNRTTRSTHSSVETENPGMLVDRLTPEDQYIAHEEKSRVQGHVRALKPVLRVPVVLYYIEGHSIARICELTGRSQSDIKVSLHRARKILKASMGIEP